jgi:uncharacterized SAM-binding protein YcdF (DUF218 family)
MRPVRWIVGLVVLVGVMVAVAGTYLAVTGIQVWWASRQDDRSPAAAVVVMGAAQWNGVPSPVLARRLDHAAELYADGVAPVVIVTGGKQTGDRVTQGFAGYRYLRAKGVPEEAIRVEVDGADSYSELSAAAVILRGEGTDVVIVTDPYHALRVEAIADEVGLRAHVSPTSTSGSPGQYLRETVAVALGRLVSFRRLAAWR